MGFHSLDVKFMLRIITSLFHSEFNKPNPDTKFPDSLVFFFFFDRHNKSASLMDKRFQELEKRFEIHKNHANILIE